MVSRYEWSANARRFLPGVKGLFMSEQETKRPDDEKEKIKDEELDKVSGGRGVEADVGHGVNEEIHRGATPERGGVEPEHRII